MKICINPGHGGKDPGAVSKCGLRESDLTLSVCMELERLLVSGGFDAVLTRTHDTYMGLTEIAEFANDTKANLTLSIHFNSHANEEAEGFEVWTTPGQNNSDLWATDIYCGLAQFVKGPGRKDVSDGDVDKEARFTVPVKCKMPTVLIECGFISNPAYCAWIRTDKFWARKIALGLMAGIKRGLMR